MSMGKSFTVLLFLNDTVLEMIITMKSKGLILESAITGLQCIQRAVSFSSLHALQAYDDRFLLSSY